MADPSNNVQARVAERLNRLRDDLAQFDEFVVPNQPSDNPLAQLNATLGALGAGLALQMNAARALIGVADLLAVEIDRLRSQDEPS